jgi:hypothetical protein
MGELQRRWQQEHRKLAAHQCTLHWQHLPAYASGENLLVRAVVGVLQLLLGLCCASCKLVRVRLMEQNSDEACVG